jgi:hypothetical protein
MRPVAAPSEAKAPHHLTDPTVAIPMPSGGRRAAQVVGPEIAAWNPHPDSAAIHVVAENQENEREARSVPVDEAQADPLTKGCV